MYLNTGAKLCETAQGIHTMLFQCWPTVFDAGPTLKQHRVNVPSLLGKGSNRLRCTNKEYQQ